MTECDLLVRGVVVTMDADRRTLTDGYIAIIGDRIAAVGRWADCEYEAASVIGGSGHVVIPGLVNTHDHLIKGCIRGMAENTRFEERLRGFYYAMPGACDEARSYTASLPVILELVRGGVTTTQDCQYTHREKRSIDGVLRAVADVGIRCRSARLIVNDPVVVPEEFCEDVNLGLEEVDRLAEKWTSDQIYITTGSLGIAYVSAADMVKIAQWTVDHDSQLDLHAPTHMDAVHLPSTRNWTGGSFEWLEREGLLGPNVLAAHALHLRPGEYELIAERGAKVAAVPGMNLLQGALKFEMRRFLDLGVPVGLGLDGPVVSYDHNLWISMREFIIGQRLADRAQQEMARETLEGPVAAFGTAELALELATIGGARALGLEDVIGSVEPGKFADVVVLDLGEALHLAPSVAALIPNLVYGGGANPGYVRDVIIGGRRVVREGTFTDFDVRRVVSNANDLQRELIDETGSQYFVNTRTAWQWID